MTTQLNAMKTALEALESCKATLAINKLGGGFTDMEADAAITTIKQALAQPVQEPVAWQVHPFDYGIGHEGVYARTDRPEQVEMWKRKGWTVQPLYTTPPTAQRQSAPDPKDRRSAWVGLTDEDFNSDMFSITSLGVCDVATIKSIAKDIEAKLKAKNSP